MSFLLVLSTAHPSKVIVGRVDYIMETGTMSFVIDKIKSIPVSNFADDPELLHWRWTGRQAGAHVRPGPTHTEDSTHTSKRARHLRLYPNCSQHTLTAMP